MTIAISVGALRNGTSARAEVYLVQHGSCTMKVDINNLTLNFTSLKFASKTKASSAPAVHLFLAATRPDAGQIHGYKSPCTSLARWVPWQSCHSPRVQISPPTNQSPHGAVRSAHIIPFSRQPTGKTCHPALMISSCPSSPPQPRAASCCGVPAHVA
jgi:hypothetical protein